MTTDVSGYMSWSPNLLPRPAVVVMGPGFRRGDSQADLANAPSIIAIAFATP
jgi:hypothetical protein